MRPAELARALRALGLSRRQAALELGISRRTLEGWAIGRSPVHPSAARLLRCWVARGQICDGPARK